MNINGLDHGFKPFLFARYLLAPMTLTRVKMNCVTNIKVNTMKHVQIEHGHFFTLPIIPMRLQIPFAIEHIPAGFPSPAESYASDYLDFNEYLVSNPAATFTVRCGGDSMMDAGINKDDLLIIDRSATAKHRDIVMACLNGAYTIKRLHIHADKTVELQSENSIGQYPHFKCNEDEDFKIIGVVTFAIKAMRG